jgi:hypothetical protein
MYIIGAIFYFIFASGEIQPWAITSIEVNGKKDIEMQKNKELNCSVETISSRL